MQQIAVVCGMSSLTLYRMGRADVVAKVLIELDEQRQVEFVVRALQGLKTEEAVEATVQVSQALASMDRPDIVADVRTLPEAVHALELPCGYP